MARGGRVEGLGGLEPDPEGQARGGANEGGIGAGHPDGKGGGRGQKGRGFGLWRSANRDRHNRAMTHCLQKNDPGPIKK